MIARIKTGEEPEAPTRPRSPTSRSGTWWSMSRCAASHGPSRASADWSGSSCCRNSASSPLTKSNASTSRHCTTGTGTRPIRRARPRGGAEDVQSCGSLGPAYRRREPLPLRADLRSNATRGNARQQHHAIGFLDRLLGLLRHHDAKLVARIWIKGLGSRSALRRYTRPQCREPAPISTTISPKPTGSAYASLTAETSSRMLAFLTRSLHRSSTQPREAISASLNYHLRTQRESRWPSNLRPRLLGPTVPDGLLRLLQRSREERPCVATRRSSEAALRTAAKGFPIPVPRSDDPPLCRWHRGFRCHRAPKWIPDVSL